MTRPKRRLALAGLALVTVSSAYQLCSVEHADAVTDHPVKIDIVGEWQYGSQWCVPAAVSTTLSAYGKYRRLKDVAADMDQPTRSTPSYDSDEPITYLNKHQRKHHFKLYVNKSLQVFRRALIRSVRHKTPVIVYTGMYYLPWYGYDERMKFDNHAITVYGFQKKNKVTTMLVWDSNVGPKRIRANKLFRATMKSYFQGQTIR